MSAAVIGAGVTITVLLILLALGLCQAGGRASRAEEQRPPVDEYQGPDSLRLLEDLDTHMKAYGNAVADLYDNTTTGDRDA